MVELHRVPPSQHPTMPGTHPAGAYAHGVHPHAPPWPVPPAPPPGATGPRSRGRAGLVAAGLVGLLFVSCAVCTIAGVAAYDPAKAEAARREAAARDRAAVTEFADRLQVLRDRFPRGEARARTTCPDEELLAMMDDRFEIIRRADVDHLAYVLGDGAAPPEGFRFLTSPRLLDFDRRPDAASYTARSNAEYIGRSDVIVVVSGDTKALPQPSDAGFVRGVYDGWLAVMQLSTGRVLCQTAVTAQSSETVVQWNGGLLDESQSEAVMTNFRDNFEDAFDDALGEITTVLDPKPL